MTTHERLNPRFVTPRAAIAGAKLEPHRDWPGEPRPALTGFDFDSATVVCTLVDLEDVEFRAWLRMDLDPRFAPAGAGLRIEVV